MKNIRIIQGDITKVTADAIVNAANPIMLGGGGVDGAIHRAAGPKLLEECRKVRAVDGIRCPFGQARITPAGNLKSKFVIHTAGPIYRNEQDPKAVLTSSYRSSLALALDNRCLSIAFPAISCGAYGYPIKDAAFVALSTCLQKEFSELEITFCLFGHDILKVWQMAFDQLKA